MYYPQVVEEHGKQFSPKISQAYIWAYVPRSGCVPLQPNMAMGAHGSGGVGNDLHWGWGAPWEGWEGIKVHFSPLPKQVRVSQWLCGGQN